METKATLSDSSFLTRATVDNRPIECLIDNGSTVTLISKRQFDCISKDRKYVLSAISRNMFDVNGQRLKIHGQTEIELKFGQIITLLVPIIVSDIDTSCILGQDFLCKHVNSIDYENKLLVTRYGPIYLHQEGATDRVCRIFTKKKCILEPNSSNWIDIEVPHKDELSETVVVECLPSKTWKNITVVQSIFKSKDLASVNVMNYGSEPVKIYPQTVLGTCTSVCEDAPVSGKPNVRKVAVDNPNTLPEYLQDCFTRSSINLDEAQKVTFKNLLIKYQHVFAKSSSDLGHTDRVQHHIDVQGATPIRQPMRKVPLAQQVAERQEVEKLLKAGIIEPSISPWSSNTVLVKKKSGDYRLCVDFRAVNALCKRDAYPLPNIGQCLDSLGGNSWFSTMDLNMGFHQMSIAPADREITAFSTSLGLFQYTRLAMGLAAAPSEFSRLMGDVLRENLKYQECCLYMDDIITPSQTFEEQIRRLEHVFQKLEESNLKLKPSKCIFLQKSCTFLGHVVSADGIATDPEKVKAIEHWPRPGCKRQVKSFLGLASYYKKFVQNFGETAKPLYQLTEKHRRFKWTSEAEEAFQTLKTCLTSTTVLAYPKLGEQMILDTDSSDFASGGVLSQMQDGNERVIAYFSKTMNKHELNYCTMRKELLAVIRSLKHFHHYIYGQKILLRTDNAAVSWLKKLKCPTGQIARWIQLVEQYDIEIIHRPGTQHRNADALSRPECKVCQRQIQNGERLNDEHEPVAQESVAPVAQESVALNKQSEAGELHIPEILDNPQTRENTSQGNVCVVTRSGQSTSTDKQCLLDGWSSSEIRMQQMQDNNIGIILAAKEDGQTLDWRNVSQCTSVTKKLWSSFDRLECREGMLFRKFIPDNGQVELLQLIVPETKIDEVLAYYHDIPSAAHLGTEKMLSRIRQTFYWPGMTESVKRYITNCDLCSARKLLKDVRAPLGQDLVGEPHEKVSIDILGPLPKTDDNNRYILVINDVFTKYCEAIALPNQEACTIAEAFVNQYVVRFGTPMTVLSDGGTNFDSKLFKEVCELLGINKVKTSVLRPQANGVTERMNRSIADMLSMYCVSSQKRWDRVLPQIMMAYRSSVHASTGQSPNKMVFGREITLPLTAVIGMPSSDEPVSVDQHVQQLQDRLCRAHQIARDVLKKKANYRKHYYDQKSKERSMAEKDLVWLFAPTRKVGVCTKLSPRWVGPCLIVRKIDNTTYVVKKSARKNEKVHHIDKLRPYKGSSVPSWIRKLLK